MLQFSGLDKLLHFLVSFLLARQDPLLSLLAGVLKELWDAAGHGVADRADLLADVLGILFAYLAG